MELRTHFAIEANDLADALNAALGTVRLRPEGYRVELTKPEGISTGGGVQALQHLRLIPPRAEMPTIVVGHANRAEQKAELRSYDHVDDLYRKQFHQPVPIDRQDYEEFLGMAGTLLEVMRLDTTVLGQPRLSFRPSFRPSSLRPARRTGVWIGFALGLVVAIAAALLVSLVRAR